jgi:hypothetical protein
MLLALKGNREVRISEDEKESYLVNGYDLFEKTEDGKVKPLVKPSKKSKEQIELEKENAELKLKLAEFEAEELNEEPKKPSGKGK